MKSYDDFAICTAAINFKNGNPFDSLLNFIYQDSKYAFDSTKQNTMALLTDEFSIYPNPADDLINIEYNFSTEGSRTFLIFDMLGREMQRMVLNSNSNLAKIKTNHLVPGLYTFSIISTGQKSYGGKITIAR